MSFVVEDLLKSLGLFAGILICLELGRRSGRRRIQLAPEAVDSGMGAVDGAIFALLGLLIAFTFSGAAARFDERRHLIVEETNAIGTAYLRLDLLSPDHRGSMQERFRRYLDTRISAYQALPDLDLAYATLDRASGMQREIWDEAVAATSADERSYPAMLLLPALNEMFDITTTRTMATKMHPPRVIFVMLGLVTLVGSLLAGEGMAGARVRSVPHTIGFAAILAATIFVILDLERPRMGFIQVETFDQALINLRATMK